MKTIDTAMAIAMVVVGALLLAGGIFLGGTSAGLAGVGLAGPGGLLVGVGLSRLWLAR